MKKYFQIIFLVIFLISCRNDEKVNVERNEKKLKIISKDLFENRLKIDSTLIKKNAFDLIVLSNSKDSDSIISVCNCEKDKKNNRIKIQLKTVIPTQRELDTMSIESRKKSRLLKVFSLDLNRELKGQFKFLTLVFKDSLVQSINLYSKSSENEYNGVDFDSIFIDKYNINVSTFDYSIASNVFGDFELRLPRGFGLIKNDTIVKGKFVCNNWIISESNEIKRMNLKN
ncbi:hypothetical protein [Gelatiniphilus marinus]|uniref:Lipoprotein n=1 Tax=Gelatiniphilus marinus TaxID=1759464 RepID=A0ABW5JW53_9FLAO